MKWLYSMVVLLTMTGCQTTSKVHTAQELFDKAKKQIKNGYSVEALETISKLQYRFPYSPLNAKADLLKADMAFQQNEWEKAYQYYQTFLKLHPHHSSKEEAEFGKILSLKNQMPSVATRDITVSKKLIQETKKFLKTYPKSEYVKRVKTIQVDIRNLEAEKEFQIGKFYFSKAHYSAALNRLDTVIQKYKKTNWYQPALQLAMEIAKKLNNSTLKQKYSQFQ